MKNRYLNQIDRLLRIIYKEINFTDLLIEDYSSSGLSLNFYDLSNEAFSSRVRNKYLEVYPNNYQKEEIDLILAFFKDKLLKEYGSANSLYLITFIAKKVLRVENSKVFVEFNDLLEWDGLINKLDANIITSAFLAYQKKIFNNNHIKNNGLIVRHNNHKLYSILDKGIAENHMHLKASGYITEMNWYYFREVSIFNEIVIKDFIQSEGVYSELSTDAKSVEKKSLNFKNLNLSLSYLNTRLCVMKIVLSKIVMKKVKCFHNNE